MHRKYILMALLFLSHSFAGYEITKYSINSGGSTNMSGDGFEMKASIGQVDSGQTSSNQDYSLNGGFWHENTDLIFKNNFKQ